MKLFKVPNKELGITKNNLLKSIKRNSILIIVFITTIIILKLLHIDKYILMKRYYFIYSIFLYLVLY